MNRPLVSVVVPVYNGERYLASALKSILEQDYRPLEVIVVDDGSADDTAKIAHSYGNVRYIYQPNQGPSAARNAGISAARGEFIAFLDADDVWAPGKLSLQMNHLIEHPEVGYTLARERVFLEPEASSPHWLSEDFLLEDHVTATPSTWVVRRIVFDQVGTFDPGYGTVEDMEWLARAKDANIQSFIMPETLLYRRVHRSNLSARAQDHLSKMLKIARGSVGRRRQQEMEDR